MDPMWDILGLAPTTDETAIRRAYAQRTRTCHPEEDPEGFLRLREAYQAALDWAESGHSSPADDFSLAEGASPDGKPSEEPEPGTPTDSEEPEVSKDGGWSLSEEEEAPDSETNPFENHEAIQTFLDLYTGKRARDSKAWMDYFTSAAFLDAAWDSRFTALLLDHVNRMESEHPPTKEFLNWLSVAYLYSARTVMVPGPKRKMQPKVEFDLENGAWFDGVDSVLAIAAKGPAPKRAKGNEAALRTSFSEYRYLLRLAGQGDWGPRAVEFFRKILGSYTMQCLKDSCSQRGNSEERHTAGLRLITHFFRVSTLPEDLCRFAWQKFDLKSAQMGRAGVLFGPLRAILMEKFPGIASESDENFMPLNKAHSELSANFRLWTSEQAQAALDEFFRRDDLMRALKNPRFVENNLLSSWTADWAEPGFLSRLLDLYDTNPGLPFSSQIRNRILVALSVQQIQQRTQSDLTSPIPDDPLHLSFSPFFRHWLNTGFYQARDPETNRPLLEYLNENLPYLPKWSRQFLNVSEETVPEPRCVTCAVGGVDVQVQFHLRYISFFAEGKEILSPCLPWEQLVAVKDTDAFFFLIPITAAVFPMFPDVQAEILRRLKDTAAPADDWEFIARCLAASICRIPLPEDGGSEPDFSVLLCEWFAEDTEHLYGCTWYEEEETLVLFEQNFQGRTLSRNRVYEDVCDMDLADHLARRLLQEMITPSGIRTELLDPLPTEVYPTPDFRVVSSSRAIPKELRGDAVTKEQLDLLFEVLAEGGLNRLELTWPAALPQVKTGDCPAIRSLVFLKEQNGWACLCFDDAQTQSFALISRPDLYASQNGEETQLIPFRQGKLFNHDIHRSFHTIRPHLDRIFRQVCRPNGVTFQAGGIWSYAVNVTHGRSKYILDKRLLGGFPVERAYNRPTAPFYVSFYPSSVTLTDNEGGSETVAVGNLNRIQVQDALIQMMNCRLSRLEMHWDYAGESTKHVVILRDGERSQLIYLDDAEKQAEFHVANPSVYMNVEGKKYPKATFCGRQVPAYLVHPDAGSLRSAVEELLSTIEDPAVVLNRFAEYTSESPVRPRLYETIRAELITEQTDDNP